MTVTRVEFKADIIINDREIVEAGSLKQAVQNEIGPSGAMLIEVTEIFENHP